MYEKDGGRKRERNKKKERERERERRMKKEQDNTMVKHNGKSRWS
jgi:hypothetical protein